MTPPYSGPHIPRYLPSFRAHFSISPKKSALSPTMYAILPLAAGEAVNLCSLLHRCLFVTVLYLDKQALLWQYIVEV